MLLAGNLAESVLNEGPGPLQAFIRIVCRLHSEIQYYMLTYKIIGAGWIYPVPECIDPVFAKASLKLGLQIRALALPTEAENCLQNRRNWTSNNWLAAIHTAKRQYWKFETKIPRKGIARPRSHFLYSHDGSAYFAAGKYVGRSWE